MHPAAGHHISIWGLINDAWLRIIEVRAAHRERMIAAEHVAYLMGHYLGPCDKPALGHPQPERQTSMAERPAGGKRIRWAANDIVEDDDLKLVAANFEDGISDAVEVELEPIDNDDSNSNNSLYEATILGTQEGLDLETGDSKTINNVNWIVLWNNGDDPIQFAENNSVEFNIDFD